MAGKKKPANRRKTVVPIDSLVCIFCRLRVGFNGKLPAEEYEQHLRNIHNIQFEMDIVMERTLILQRPSLMLEKRADASVQADVRVLSQNIIEGRSGLTVTRIKKEPSEIPEVKLEDKLMEITEKHRIPWFAGCEYQCRVKHCGEMFFYNEDLRLHVKKNHGDPDEYLDKYKMFETKTDHIVCKECSLKIKRHYSSVFLHLREKHNGMTIEDYAKKYKMKENYEKTVVFFKKVQVEVKSEDIRSPSRSSTPTSKKRRLVPDAAKPTMKKAKVSLERIPTDAQSSSSTSPVPSTSKRSSVDAPNRLWFQGCEFTCQICKCEFFELNDILLHVKSKHGMNEKPYQEKYGKLETKRIFYKCKICFHQVKHTKSFIANHLIAVHNMKFEAYVEIFYPSNSQGEVNEHAGKMKENLKKKPSMNIIPMSQAKNDPVFREWARGTCTFQCGVCGYKSGGSVDFWKHVKNVHKLDIQAYKDKYENPCVVLNKIACKICSKILRYDYGTLLGHSNMMHNLTLIEFYSQYYQKEVESLKNENNAQNDDGQSKEAKSLELVPKFGRSNAGPAAKRAHLWGWKCKYSCAICKRPFSSRVGVQKHINVGHKMNIKEYVSKYGAAMVEKVIHSCLICNGKILHDPSVIGMHTSAKHGISLKEYFLKYIERSKEGARVKVQKSTVKKTSHIGVAPKSNSRSSKPVKVAKKRTRASGKEDHYVWANNGVRFKCKVCNEYSTKVMCTLYCHITKTHGMDAKTYKTMHGNYAENEKRHKCHICGNLIIRRATNIVKHLAGAHSKMKLTLKQYYEKFIRGHEAEGDEEETNNTHSIKSVQSKGLLSASVSIDSDQWMNRCAFECKFCSIQYNSKTDFKIHIAEAHDTNYEKYLADVGDPVVVMNLHCCLMCQEMVMCDGEDISDHLGVAHALSLEDYHDRYIANDRTIATVKKQNPLYRNWNHDSQIHDCLLCHEPVEFNQALLETHMKSHGIDLRTYEKRFRHELDVVFLAFEADNGFEPALVEIENDYLDGDEDDDFGSVFEEEDEEEPEEGDHATVDPLAQHPGLIQSPEDIDDIDIEDNFSCISETCSTLEC